MTKLALALILLCCLSATAQEKEQRSFTVSDEDAEKCREEGGCALITRKMFEKLNACGKGNWT